MRARAIREVPHGELVERLRDRARYHFWNVVTDDAWDGRLIPGSRRAPLDRLVRTAREAALLSDSEIVVYGSGPACPEARLGAEKLVAAGYDDVSLYPGGVEGWLAAGEPIDPGPPS